MIASSISTKFRRFICLICDKSYRIDSVSTAILYLSHIFSAWNVPHILMSPQSTFIWCIYIFYTITEKHLNSINLFSTPYNKFDSIQSCRWLNELKISPSITSKRIWFRQIKSSWRRFRFIRNWFFAA
jgi:hypothetical protein